MFRVVFCRLTAFVVKSFAQARTFIPEYVDVQMLDQSLEWMSRQTNRDGSFKKVGEVHSSALKVIAQPSYIPWRTFSKP